MRAWHNGMMVAWITAMGCSETPVTPGLADAPSETLGSFQISPSVAILAVGGSQQLSVAGISLTGTPVASLDSVRYVLNNLADTVRVRLASSGLVSGLASSSSSTVLVNAFAYQRDIARGDQAIFQVTPTVVPGLTLSIQPVAPDSAKQAIGTAKVIVPVLRNPTTGASIASPAMRYTVKLADAKRIGVYTPRLSLANGTVVQLPPSPTVTANQILPQVPTGAAWIYAAANVYGTLLQDSVQYAFSYPYTATMATGKSQLEVTNGFAYVTLTLAPGAIVTFSNTVAATDPLMVAYAFDTPAAATATSPASAIGGASGNVTALTGGQTSRRQFLTLGMYHWTATAAGGPAPWSGQTLTGILVIR